MPLPRSVIEQLARPHGALSPLVARYLNLVNGRQQRQTIELLHLRPEDRVLEVGFGGAGTFPALLAAVPNGQVIGVEVSAEMAARASRSFAGEVAAGRLSVEVASVDALPFADASVDAALAVNATYFWRDLPQALASLRRVLVPGGRLVLSIAPESQLERAGFARHGFHALAPAQYVAELDEVGFADARVEALAGAHGSVAVLARNP